MKCIDAHCLRNFPPSSSNFFTAQVVPGVHHEAVPGSFEPGCSGLLVMVLGE